MKSIRGLGAESPIREARLRMLVTLLSFLGPTSQLLASPRISVTPMIQRLSDEDRRNRSLIVSTQIVLAESTRIYLDLVRPDQKETGRVDWVGDTERTPIFSLPFTERLLPKGTHVLSFKIAAAGHRLKPLRFAVAITYKDREALVSGPGRIKLKADVRLRQIFQITHPGSQRGARRYQINVGDEVVDQKGFMALTVTNRTESPFYLKASAQLSAVRSRRSESIRPRSLFLPSDGDARRDGGEITLYPHFPVRVVADFRNVAPGDYRARLSLVMRDRLGKRSSFIMRDFEKTSLVSKKRRPKRLLKNLKVSVDHSRRSTEITLVGHGLSGLLRMTVMPDDESCRLRASRALARRGHPTRIILVRVRPSARCVITATHQSGEAKFLIEDGLVKNITPKN